MSFAPRLPEHLTSLAFCIVYRQFYLRVEVTTTTATYRLTRGSGTMQITHHGEPLTLNNFDPIERPIPASMPTESPTLPPGRALCLRERGSGLWSRTQQRKGSPAG
nr:glycosyl hydrolase family 65 protein [Fundidesulfovibrio soli]